MTLDIRNDLRLILPEWSALPVPTTLQAAAKYVAKMHAEPFEVYLNRLKRLTGGGAVALDAGSGTGTWSLPMANLFDRVIAVDKNRPRIDFARWLVARAGCTRIQVDYGDITDLDCPDESVDFVFSFGVVISYLPLRAVLREFRRVTRRGGWIYLCLNGIGWSQHLRDDRGANSPLARIQGQRGLYNTLCQTQQSVINKQISQLLVQIACEGSKASQVCSAAGIESTKLLGFLMSCREAQSLADLTLPEARSGLGLSRLLDRLFAAVGEASEENRIAPVSIPLSDTLADIDRECGPEFVEQFGLDLVQLLLGRRAGFSFSNAGRCYTPQEVIGLCTELGLTEFRWGGEGELIGETGRDIPAPSFFAPAYNGQLGVWEFLVQRP